MLFPMSMRFKGEKFTYKSKSIKKYVKVRFRLAKKDVKPSLVTLPTGLTLNQFLLYSVVHSNIINCYVRKFPYEDPANWPDKEFTHVAIVCSRIIINSSKWKKPSYWSKK